MRADPLVPRVRYGDGDDRPMARDALTNGRSRRHDRAADVATSTSGVYARDRNARDDGATGHRTDCPAPDDRLDRCASSSTTTTRRLISGPRGGSLGGRAPLGSSIPTSCPSVPPFPRRPRPAVTLHRCLTSWPHPDPCAVLEPCGPLPECQTRGLASAVISRRCRGPRAATTVALSESLTLTGPLGRELSALRRGANHPRCARIPLTTAGPVRDLARPFLLARDRARRSPRSFRRLEDRSGRSTGASPPVRERRDLVNEPALALHRRFDRLRRAPRPLRARRAAAMPREIALSGTQLVRDMDRNDLARFADPPPPGLCAARNSSRSAGPSALRGVDHPPDEVGAPRRILDRAIESGSRTPAVPFGVA